LLLVVLALRESRPEDSAVSAAREEKVFLLIIIVESHVQGSD
jgi:hypothetical protein